MQLQDTVRVVAVQRSEFCWITCTNQPPTYQSILRGTIYSDQPQELHAFIRNSA